MDPGWKFGWGEFGRKESEIRDQDMNKTAPRKPWPKQEPGDSSREVAEMWLSHVNEFFSYKPHCPPKQPPS